MRVAVPALFVMSTFLTLSACPDGELVPLCPGGAECWTNADGFLVVGEPIPFARSRGACQAGHVECRGSEVICVGEVQPEFETCNGLDDDCDGTIDDELLRYPSDPENTCPAIGECRFAYQRCRNDVTVCDYTREPSQDVCNGLDDDCDGEVDEGLAEPVYNYPSDEYPLTVGVGACRPGVVSCVSGVERIVSPTTPVKEVCGNDIDDDCDGLTDEPEEDEAARAIALVIDVSGSMADELTPMTQALCFWAEDFSGEAPPWFAIVLVTSGTSYPFVTIYQPFADAEATCASLSSTDFDIGLGTGSNEYMLEGVMTAALGLDWPPAAEERHVIAFGDEEQHYALNGNVEADVVDVCTDPPGDQSDGFTLDAFIGDGHLFDWYALTSDCGGVAYNLDETDLIIDRLRSRIAGSCAP